MFSLDPVYDSVLSVPAAGFFLTGLLLPEPNDFSAEPFGWFDEHFIFPLNEKHDRIGDVVTLTTFLPVPLLMFQDITFRERAVISVMYAESFLLTIGIKDVMKRLVARPRPYVTGALPGDPVLDESDSFASFPSGHTAFSFMNAAFAAYVCARGPAPPAVKWLVGILGFGAALFSSALRIESGVHYVTDVVAGAAIGITIGIGVPWLHTLFSQGPDQ